MGFWDGIEKGRKKFAEEFEKASEDLGAALGRGIPWLLILIVPALLLLGTCAACIP